MTTRARITTFDNPFNPFTEFEEWYAYDNRAGHDTLSLLARVTVTSDELSEEDKEIANENAIDEIVSEDPDLKFKKVLEK